MRSLIAISIGFLTASALGAQSMPNIGPGAYTDALALHNNDVISQSYDQLTARTDTPEQQKARLAKAVALKAEAVQLAAADGGTMSPKHLASIRAKAKAIMAN